MGAIRLGKGGSCKMRPRKRVPAISPPKVMARDEAVRVKGAISFGDGATDPERLSEGRAAVKVEKGRDRDRDKARGAERRRARARLNLLPLQVLSDNQ